MPPPQYADLVVSALGRLPAFKRSGGLDHAIVAPPRGMRSVFASWRQGHFYFSSLTLCRLSPVVPEPAEGIALSKPNMVEAS